MFLKFIPFKLFFFKFERDIKLYYYLFTKINYLNKPCTSMDDEIFGIYSVEKKLNVFHFFFFFFFLFG